MRAAAAVAIVMLLLPAPSPAAKEVYANALFYGGAMLTVDGEPVMLRVGDEQRGVKLIEADGEHAVVEIDGREKTLTLDRSAARRHTTPEEFERHSRAKSHVIEARLVRQRDHAATFEVDYYCDERLGDAVVLIARTLLRGEDTGYWAHTHTPLETGRHTAEITIGMNEKSPQSYLSDALQFDLVWGKGGESGTAGALVMKFIKQWRRGGGG